MVESPFVVSTAIRRWGARLFLALVVVSVIVWFTRRDRLPWKIRIATGESGGLYHDLGESLQATLVRQLGRDVEILTTTGSVENHRLLQSGEADLAIVQGGAVPLNESAIITPLYPEWVMVVARKDRGIESVFDLVGRRVAIGKPGSGMRESAATVLERLQMGLDEFEPVEAYFKEMLDDESVDAAIVTTGIVNRDFRQLLKAGDFDILPIADSQAIGMIEPYFRAVEIPKGVFGERPALPPKAEETLATTAYLVTRTDASNRLVEAALKGVHEENLKLSVPTLIARSDAPHWTATRMHETAQRYFSPADDIGFLANVMESLAAGKELLFALGAGIYLLWRRWKALRERELQAMISEQKEHLDVLLEQTLGVEKELLKTDTPEALQALLDRVARIKFQALREFTEEELRGDQAFRIFLAQCRDVISEIQLKIIGLSGREAP